MASTPSGSHTAGGKVEVEGDNEFGEPEQGLAKPDGVDVGVEDGAEGHGGARFAALAGG